MNNIKTITTLDELLNFVADISYAHPGKELFFRGETKVHPEISPGIGTKPNGLKNEDILFNEYILKNPNEFNDDNYTISKLAKMQHYGLPTRLLDITSSLLMALFFAVEDANKVAQSGEETNGEDKESKEDYNNKHCRIIIFPLPKNKVKYYTSDTVSVLANIAKRPHNRLNIASVNKASLTDFNQHSDIQYLIHEIKHEKPYFKDYVRQEDLESIVCVKTPLNNRRIISQQGAFLLFGLNQSKNQLATFNPNHFMPIEVHIPNSSKKQLLDNLTVCGITPDVIYPEMDKVAGYLKDKYCK